MRGRALHNEAAEIILKVLAFFEKEKENGCVLYPVDQVIKKTCAATGIAERTLLNLKKRAKAYQASIASSAIKSDGNLLPPRPARKPRPRKIVLDHIDLCALKDIVDNFYATRKEEPTLSKILNVAICEINFRGGKTTLRNILYKELGYRFRRYRKELLVPHGSRKAESGSESDDSSSSDYSDEKSMSGAEDQKVFAQEVQYVNDTDHRPMSGIEQNVAGHEIARCDEVIISGTRDQIGFYQERCCNEEPMSSGEIQNHFCPEIKYCKEEPMSSMEDQKDSYQGIEQNTEDPMSSAENQNVCDIKIEPE